VEYGLAWYSQSTVSALATVPTASEQGLAPGTFTVSRSGDLTSALTVNYTASGTATPGSDFAAISGTVTIPANTASMTVAVSPLADTLAEGPETVVLTINSDPGYSIGAGASATVSIADIPADAWRSSKFTATELTNPSVSGDAADPDGDGIANLVEYALGMEPKTGNTSGLPVATLPAGGPLNFTYSRAKAATDVTFTVEVCNEVSSWNSGPAFTQVTQTTDNGTTETITVMSLLPPGPDNKQFMRLRLTRP
jgi:hypothetical protein